MLKDAKSSSGIHQNMLTLIENAKGHLRAHCVYSLITIIGPLWVFFIIKNLNHTLQDSRITETYIVTKMFCSSSL